MCEAVRVCALCNSIFTPSIHRLDTMHSARQLIRLVRGPLRPHPLIQSRLMASQSPLKAGQTDSETRQSGPSAEAKDKARRLTIATGAATAFFGASYILYLQLRAQEVSNLSGYL